MPAKLAIIFEMGVGDVQIEDFSNNLDMEVGVGAIRVETRNVDYRNIQIAAVWAKHLSAALNTAAMKSAASSVPSLSIMVMES